MNKKENKILIYIRRELYLIDNLRTKILIENDILELKNIVINIIDEKAYIDSYKTSIKISIKSRDEFIQRKIYIKFTTIIFARSNVLLSIKVVDLSTNLNFLFEFSS